MRLRWSDEALADLERIAEWAPRSADQLLRRVEALARTPFPAMYRLAGPSGDHALTVAPYVVFYRVDGDVLLIEAIEDARGRRQPW